MDGINDYVWIYNRALTAEEVYGLYSKFCMDFWQVGTQVRDGIKAELIELFVKKLGRKALRIGKFRVVKILGDIYWMTENYGMTELVMTMRIDIVKTKKKKIAIINVAYVNEYRVAELLGTVPGLIMEKVIDLIVDCAVEQVV